MRYTNFETSIFLATNLDSTNDIPMTPTRIFSFVSTVSMFMNNDVVVTRALANVRPPMNVDRSCGMLVVNPLVTTVQHRTIAKIIIVSVVFAKYIPWYCYCSNPTVWESQYASTDTVSTSTRIQIFG